MGSRKLTPEDLDRITKLAKGWGKIVVRRAFGHDGPGLDFDFDQMEEVAAAARGLTAGAIEEVTSQQGRLLGAEHPPVPYVVGNAPSARKNVPSRWGAI